MYNDSSNFEGTEEESCELLDVKQTCDIKYQGEQIFSKENIWKAHLTPIMVSSALFTIGLPPLQVRLFIELVYICEFSDGHLDDELIAHRIGISAKQYKTSLKGLCSRNLISIKGSDYTILNCTHWKWEKKDKYINPGYIYIIRKETEDIFKIGKSKNPELRIKQLSTGNERQLVLIEKYNVSDMTSTEMYLKRYFESKKINREWFALTSSDLVEIGKIIANLESNSTSSNNASYTVGGC